MLHVLKHTTKDQEFYYLTIDREYIIGRKNTNIVISDDQSISRKHAIIKVQKNSLVLIDCGSKYGTVHNSSKVVANKEISLKDKDEIKFGVFTSTYRLETMKLATTGSGLTNEQKVELKKKISDLGGIFHNNWEESCTFVTAQEIMLTIKILHALVDDKPIVTLKYWDQCISSVEDQKPLPKVEDFKPPVAETLINRITLTPNPLRKSLFKDKIFVFPTEKIKNRMADLITKTGGSSISWEKEPLTLLQVTKSKNNYLFIHCDEMKETPQSLKEIFNHLINLGERTIPIQEIAMSIVLCSCEKDCNPKFNRLHSVFVKQPPDSSSAVFALACETPSEIGSLEPPSPKKELIIPESLDTELQFLAPSPIKASLSLSTIKVSPSLSKNVTEKPQTSNKNPFIFLSSKRTEKHPEITPSKKIRLEPSTPSTSQVTLNSKKRKADENVPLPTPKKSTLKENPFAVFMKRIPTKKPSADNPFASLSTEKQPKTREDNPFKKVANLTHNKVVDLTQNSDHGNTTLQKSINVSNIKSFNETYCPSNVSSSNVSWKLKNRDKNSDPKIEVNPDFKEEFDRFKDVTVIEIIPITTITALVSRLFSQEFDESTTSSSGKKNFKKFRKSMPRRRQTTIISLVDPDNSKQQENQVVSLSEDEDEAQIIRPSVKKTSKNPFKL